VHLPSAVLQVPTTQTLPEPQVLAVPAAQVPFAQTSPIVHRLSSSQGEVFAT